MMGGELHPHCEQRMKSQKTVLGIQARQSARPKKSKQKARPKRKERTAEVALRYRKIELRPPPPAPPDVRITHPAVLLSVEAPDSSRCG